MKPRSRKWGITGSLLAAIVLAAMLAGPAFAGPPGGGCTSPYASNDYHEWVVIEESFATCTEPGSREWLCENCREHYYEDVPALGHSWDGGSVTAVATCTQDGVVTYSCYNCGATYTEAIPATGHDWDGGTVTQAATCTADGVMTYTCYNCGAAYTEAVPATGHSPAHVAGYAATCTEAGLTDGSVCSVCGEILTAQTAIPATGHNWDGGTVTQAATCTADGVRTYTCYNCGAAYTEAIPATGHSPVSVAGYAATCTEAGLTDGSVCSVCGEVLTAQTAIPATGHDWDEGVVIREPDGDTPGIMLYTCRNNPAHTWTEEIEPTTTSATTTTTTSSIFNLMRKIPPEAADAGGMVVTLQPEGGRITYNGSDSHTMTIAVEGGVEPYTYEWHYTTKLDMPDSLSQMAADRFKGAADSYLGKATSFSSGFLSTMQAQGQASGEKTLAEQEQKTKLETQAVDLNDHILGDSNSPTYKATIGNCDYYCIIRDSAGHEAYTDDAYVGYHLYIAQQPENANIYGKDVVTLTCCAGGGNSDEYMYMINSVDGYELLNGATAEITEPGEYYFTASDGVEEIDSQIVTVYYNDNPLWINSVNDSSLEIIPEIDTVDLQVTFGGGKPPYFISWTKDGEKTDRAYVVDEEPIADDEPDERYTILEPGWYSIALKDSMGETVQLDFNVIYKQLKIAKQPEGGMLSVPDNGLISLFDLSITMAEGDAPFKYDLILNGELYESRPDCIDTQTFRVFEPGKYHIEIEDANGRWAVSDKVIVRDNEFGIFEYTKEAWVTDENQAELYVGVEGGHAPYTYTWRYESRDYGLETIYVDTWETDQDTVYVNKIGFYNCTVMDADGNEDYVDGIEVYYSGEYPVIILHPQSSLIAPDENGLYICNLACDAVRVDGTSDGLNYQWQKETGADCWELLSEDTSGKTLELSGDDSVLGFYRCVVHDMKNGKTTYSNKAVVMDTIVCSISGIEARVGGYLLNYNIYGGKPPYTVNVYEYRPAFSPYQKDTIYADYCYETITVDHMGDGEIPVPLVYYYFIEMDESGTLIPQLGFSEYYLIVTDAAGHIEQTEKFDYWSQF